MCCSLGPMTVSGRRKGIGGTRKTGNSDMGEARVKNDIVSGSKIGDEKIEKENAVGEGGLGQLPS